MAELFSKEQAPKRPPIKRMHVVDAGNGLSGKVIQFECRRCGHNTGWIEDTCSVSDNKRGLPCPKCNGEDHG